MTELLKTDIVILGAGIGGYEAFRTLNGILKRRGIGARITIVDQNNYFTFVPLLHEVATGSVESTHASIPLRELVYGTPHSFVNAKIEKLDRVKKQVHTSSGIIEYEYCVIALGSTVNYFKTLGAEKYAHHVRTLEDALYLKYALVRKLETCEGKAVNITVVGGGYTGVEVAGQYGTLKQGDIKKLYPNKSLNVRIIDPGKNILSNMKPGVQSRVKQRLEKLGVEFKLGCSVTEVGPESVTLNTGEKLVSEIVVWAAGFGNLGGNFVEESLCEKGRIKVDEYLRIVGDESCYAIGDIAFAGNSTGTPFPQLAEVAHKEGEYIAKHIVASLKNKKINRFVFHSKGQLMPVGDWFGVAVVGNITIYGRLAWWMRRTVYVLYMPGILRKLRIVLDWTVHSFGFGHFIHLERKK